MDSDRREEGDQMKIFKSEKHSLKGWDLRILLKKNRKQLYLLGTGMLLYFNSYHPLVKVIGAPIIYIAINTLDFYINEVKTEI